MTSYFIHVSIACSLPLSTLCVNGSLLRVQHCQWKWRFGRKLKLIISLHLFVYLATNHMTTFNEVFHREKQVLISWTLPNFLPDHYLDIVSCKLWCDPTTYYLSELVTNKLSLSITIYGVHPGSICSVKHLTVYNPASIDQGIGLTAHSPYSSKFWMVSFDSYISFYFHILKLTYVHVCISLLDPCPNAINCKFLCFFLSVCCFWSMWGYQQTKKSRLCAISKLQPFYNFSVFVALILTYESTPLGQNLENSAMQTPLHV